jgi:hypothetical protein
MPCCLMAGAIVATTKREMLNGACSSGSAGLWEELGAGREEAEELRLYSANHFDFSRLPARYPLPDEPFVESWRACQAEARLAGVLPCLLERLIELRFPIERGIGESELYRAVTRRGEGLAALPAEPGFEFVRPEGLTISLHPTPAGVVPVLTAAERQDFVNLVRALTRRNEPWPVPSSMGACVVTGYNDWGRIHELRRQWEATGPGDRSPGAWPVRFREIASEPALYQDRFIILSRGPYSAVSAGAMGLSEQEWNRRSQTIRLEHECTHYFTRQVLGSMRNALTDELIADYMGIVASEERYQADWSLRFLGLEEPGRYRPGGRLQNYRGEPPLSDGAFRVLQEGVRRAALNLERLDRDCLPLGAKRDLAHQGRMIVALCRLGLQGLISEGAAQLFREAWAQPAIRKTPIGVRAV